MMKMYLRDVNDAHSLLSAGELGRAGYFQRDVGGAVMMAIIILLAVRHGQCQWSSLGL